MEHIDQPASRGFILVHASNFDTLTYASNGDPVIERRQTVLPRLPGGP